MNKIGLHVQRILLYSRHDIDYCSYGFCCPYRLCDWAWIKFSQAPSGKGRYGMKTINLDHLVEVFVKIAPLGNKAGICAVVEELRPVMERIYFAGALEYQDGRTSDEVFKLAEDNVRIRLDQILNGPGFPTE